MGHYDNDFVQATGAFTASQANVYVPRHVREGRTVFVTNIKYAIEADLYRIFRPCGAIVSVVICRKFSSFC